MKHPILFSTPMVQAILAGRKTQTRRIMKPQPCYSEGMGKWVLYPKHHPTVYADLITADKYCPYGKLGDVLWVRETWFDAGNYFIYKADCPIRRDDENISESDSFKWKPSIFMPKEACRIRLEIINIRVERLCDISEEDAMAEGIMLPNYAEQAIRDVKYPEPSDIYAELWDEINGTGSWIKNPWVWVIEFQRVTPAKEGK